MRGAVGTVRSLATVLGLGLVFLGGAKLAARPEAIEPLLAVGVPTALIPVVAWVEILVGAMLAHRPLQRLGATVLSAWMLGATVLHVRAGDVGGATLALALFGVAVLLAALTRREELLPPDGIPTPLARRPEGVWATARYLASRVGPAFLFRWAVGGELFWASLPVMGVAQARREASADLTDHLHGALLYLFFFGFGVGGLWNFTGHFFLSDAVAASTGWPAGNPFQHELAFYHLGSGVVGLLCLWWRDRFWAAAALVPSVFAYGAVLIHVREFLTEANTAPANWGFGAVGANLIIPTVVLGLLAAYWRRGGFAVEREARNPGGTRSSA